MLALRPQRASPGHQTGWKKRLQTPSLARRWWAFQVAPVCVGAAVAVAAGCVCSVVVVGPRLPRPTKPAMFGAKMQLQQAQITTRADTSKESATRSADVCGRPRNRPKTPERSCMLSSLVIPTCLKEWSYDTPLVYSHSTQKTTGPRVNYYTPSSLK